MTRQLLSIAFAGLLWISVLMWLLRGMGRLRATVAWVSAWVSIWVAGMLMAANPTAEESIVSSVLGTLFAGLLWVGSYRFGDRPVPRALPPLIAVLTLAVALVEWRAVTAVGIFSSVVDVSLVGFAAVLLIRHHTLNPELGPAERAIGPLFLVIMLLKALDWQHHHAIAPNDMLSAWAGVGVTTGLLMVSVVGERARFRAREQAAALEAESNLLHGMSEAVPVGILLSDPDGMILIVNASMCEQVGVDGSPESWIGRSTAEILKAALGNLMEAEQRDVVAAAPIIARDRMRSVSGQTLRFADGRTILMSAHSIHGTEGRHLGRVWVSRDVTEERRIGERLQHAERMETVGTLAGGLAHDFNNQLTAILGSAVLVRESKSLSEEDRLMLADLEEAAQHCADLTRGLLTFSRREPADPRDIDLRSVVARVDTLLRPLLPPDVIFRSVIAEEARYIHADETQIQRVLTNLLVNARDAVGSRGTIELSAQTCDGGIELVVGDDGHGMAESIRRRIFDPFFTTKPVGSGTGLGLAIVYGIVDAHGGRVEVESTPGRGTTFRIVWPRPNAETDEAGVAAPATVGPPRGSWVLLAEDEPSVRRIITRTLRRVGLEVTAVTDGDAAIAEFEVRPGAFDILLFDYSMPGCSGLEAIRKIRELRPNFPAVVMSGHPSRSGHEDWPSDVPLVLKPFVPEVLIERLAEAMVLDEEG